MFQYIRIQTRSDNTEKCLNKKGFSGYGKPQKKILLGTIKRGGGVKGRAIKENKTFFGTFFSNIQKFQRPLSSRGSIKRRTFFAASLLRESVRNQLPWVP